MVKEMISVGQLAQQLLTLEPQKSPARLAFYHFIKNFLPLEATFRQEMIDQFYDRALVYQYWQSNKSGLGQTVRDDLVAISARNSLGIDLEQVLHVCDLQFVSLEQPRDFSSLLQKDVKRMEKLGERIRLFHLSPDNPTAPMEVLMLRLQKTGNVIAETRTNIATIVDGELVLVRPMSRLTYTADLELEPKVDQLLVTSLLRVCRFEMHGSGHNMIAKGNFLQGATFHRAETFEKPVEKVPELFQAIKKIERYYVNPVTDPYYNQIMQNFGQAFHENSPDHHPY